MSRNNSNKRIDTYKIFYYVEKLHYVWWCLLGSLVFWFSNLALFVSILIVPIKLTTIPLYTLFSINVGPSFYALLAAFFGLKTGKPFLKTYFNVQIHDFWKAFKIWSPTVIAIGLIMTNLVLSQLFKGSSIYQYFLVFIALCLVTYVVNLYSVLVYFKRIRVKKACLLTAQLSIIKSGRYAMGTLLLLGIFAILSIRPLYLTMFGWGIYAMLMVLNFKPIASFIQNLEN